MIRFILVPQIRQTNETKTFMSPYWFPHFVRVIRAAGEADCDLGGTRNVKRARVRQLIRQASKLLNEK
jgi:hypothetical protein